MGYVASPYRIFRSNIAGVALGTVLATLGVSGSVGASPPSGHNGRAQGNSRGRFHRPKPSPLVELQLLAFNDYHGHVEAETAGNLEGEAAGGAEYLSAKLNDLRLGHPYSLTVAAGDLVGGSPFFSGLFHDEPSVESLNALKLDVSSVGNHEFDEGVSELLRLQEGGCHPVDGCYFSDPYAGANFQWLAANVVDTTGQSPLPPYWIKNVGGIKVAFIGITLEATDTLVAAAGIEGYSFLNEAETANQWVPVLHRKGVQAIVVLLHEGGIASPFSVDECEGISGPIVEIHDALSPSIDAVITGHTHLPYNCVLSDPAGQPRIVTSAFSNGRVVSELNLVLDRRTRDIRRSLSTSTNHAVTQGELSPDPALTAVINKWAPLAEEAGSTQVGAIADEVSRGGDPAGSDRGVESSAGNLVADAQLWAASAAGAEISLMNPGGVRADLAFESDSGQGDGVVTFGEAFAVLPFNNRLFTFPMTGAQLVSVLEEQCQPPGGRPVLHLGVSQGFTYEMGVSIEDGECTEISIDNVALYGTPLDLDDSYLVTVNGFLADGGDNFTTFSTLEPSLRVEGESDLLALVNYLGAFSPLAPPGTDRVNEL